MKGSFGIYIRGTITEFGELRQTKNGKLMLRVKFVVNTTGSYTDKGEFFDMTLFGAMARRTADFVESGYWQKGDIICLDNAREQVSVYFPKDQNGQYQKKDGEIVYYVNRNIFPNSNKMPRRENGKLVYDEDGNVAMDYMGGFEIVPGPKHVYKGAAEADPDPEQEREAIPPKQQGFVEVDEELPF